MGGWTIEVFNSTGRKVGEDSTDSTGYWQVCGLVPGNYRVNEILQPGWISISKPAEVILGCHNIINQNFTNLKDSASIHIVKRTNGVDSNTAPGQNIPVGSPVTWSYEVKNTGNVVLTNVVVTDDKLGQIGTIASLAVGETKTLTTLPGPIAVAGQYSNNATAIGKTPDESEVSDTDPDYYFGLAPGISLVKKTNGVDSNAAPGQNISVGSPVTWSI